MTRNFILIFLLGATILSCKRSADKTKKSKIEIIKIGAPQYIDTTDFSKIGGIIYVSYDEDNDSALFKTCMMKQLIEQNTYPTDSLTAKYFNVDLQDSQKAHLNYFINYLKPLNDGRLQSTYRDPEMIGCNLLGTWIAILTNSLGERHYFNFPIYNLPKEIETLCENIYLTGYRGMNRPGISYRHINTDSIVGATLKLKSMDNIELAPRIKSNIKFTPPEIQPNN